MKKIKILTVVGTRPEIIRLSRVISLLENNLNSILIHTGQNYDYELNKIFFKDLGLKKPKYQINNKKNSNISCIANILIQIEKIIIKEKPDGFLVLGDTNSCLSAYVAKRYKVPIFHIEAGNRCYDLRVPEEINRRIIDNISDINITYSKVAKQNLIRENIDPDKIFQVGSPLYEVYDFYKNKIRNSKILQKLGLKKDKYYLLSVHREENIENSKNFKKLLKLLIFLDRKSKNKIIISTHPRTMKKIKKIKNMKLKKTIFHKPFSYIDYSSLQINANVVLSDSGSITEEANIMGFKAINLRTTNERQEGMEYGVLPMTHFDIDKISSAISIIHNNNLRNLRVIDDYKSINFSNIILNLIISYTQYIKEYTWKEYNI